MDDLDLDLDLGDREKTRIFKPKIHRPLGDINIKYSNAADMAKGIGLPKKDTRLFSIIPGNFIFGDLIEAFVVENNLNVQDIKISTLSMSEANVDSLANLINGGYADDLSLILSSYFFQHEKFKMVRYIYEELDGPHNKFQLAVAACHVKMCIIKTQGNGHYVFHGSANLRSSDCLEQFVVEESKDLFSFTNEWMVKVIMEYKTINKDLRGTKLWGVLQKQGQAEVGAHGKKVQRQKKESPQEKNNSWEV